MLPVGPGHFDCWVAIIDLDEAALYLIQYVAGRPAEGPLHVLLALGRSLQVQHIEIPGQLQGIITIDHSLLTEISLFSH